MINNNKTERIRFGIKFKLSVFVILLILIIISIITFILTYTISQREEKSRAIEMLQNMNVAIDYLTSTSKEGIIAMDDLIIVSLIKKIADFKDVEYVILTDNKNKVIAHSKGFEQTGKILDDPMSKEALLSDATLIQPNFSPGKLVEQYDISSPIMFKNRKIGIARIGYSTKSIFKSIQDVKNKIIITSLIIMLGTILLGIIGSIILASFTTKPIKHLVDGIRRIGQGNLDYVIPLRNKDEIGYLAKEFNKMTGHLKEYQKILIEREVEQNQLEVAKNIQKSLIPLKNYITPQLHIAGFSRTVFGVGGDYYDYFPISEDKMGIIISDVFGKGIPASLVMVVIRTLLHTYSESTIIQSTAKVVSAINKKVGADFHEEQYATLFFIIINFKTGRMMCTNAGHGPLTIFRRDEGKFLTRDFGEVPVGMTPEMEYTQFETMLKKGDLILLNTDGITEAENPSGEQYKDKRLKLSIIENKNHDAETIVSNVVKQVDTFTGTAPQHDDMTLIIIDYKGT